MFRLTLVLTSGPSSRSFLQSKKRWEVPVDVIQMPWRLKTAWHDALKPLVEEWIGGEELVSVCQHLPSMWP